MSAFLSDEYTFYALQIVIVGAFVVGLFQDWIKPARNRREKQMAWLKYGQVTMEKFRVVHAFTLILLLQVINVSDAAVGYKVFWSILDLLILVYFFYFSKSAQNKVSLMWGWYQEKHLAAPPKTVAKN